MNLNDKTSSFGLIRTNPKISGNVKITIDSTGLIWLNSFDSTKELSSSDFKKFRIGGNGSSYESDLKKFMSSLPPDIVFAVKENKPNPENISNTYKDQYDFFYNMGAENLISKFYDEDYSYLAPLWLREDLPEYFVIFRVDEPLDFPYNENVESGNLVVGKKYVVKGDATLSVQYGVSNFYSNGESFIATSVIGTTYTVVAGTGKVILLDENKALPINTIQQFESIAKRAQLIKTFDLGETTPIGIYIRNILNNKFLPPSPITARFDKGLMTTWNGVSYKDGIMTSKGELLEEYWSKGQLQIDFEEYITKGFERHGIICPYLLNLEFLFNDPETPTYSIPRYFGFYVNKIELAKMQLDGDALFANRFISGNTPAPKRSNKGFRHSTESFFQQNENGVRLFYTNEIQIDPAVPLFIPDSTTFTNNFESRFYWLQDKNNNFYSVDQTGNNSYNTTAKDLVLRNHSVDLGNFTGTGTVKLQAKGNKLVSKGRSYMVIKINDPVLPLDSFSLYWNLGVLTDANGLHHKIVANDLSNRPFTIPANGTVMTIAGMDITSQYQINQTIEIKYGVGKSVVKTLVAAPVFTLGNTILTIDSPIDLTTTSATTPIVPGWGPGSALIEDNNQTIYFHPYGTFNEIATSIAKAFNLIEDRTFDAVAMNNEVVIRLRQGESITNSFFMMGNFTISTDVAFQDLPFVSGQKYFFVGGTDTAHIRLRFPLVDTDILKDGEVFIKTKRGLSKIAFVGKYVDEAIAEVGGSDIGTFKDYDKYGALYISDNLDEPTITTTGDFIAYNLYNIPVGLFSIFNVKEIDGDFFSSTYSRSPIAEVYRYFDINSDTPRVLVPGRTYLVKSDVAGTDLISYLGNTYYGSVPGSTQTTFIAGSVTNEQIAIGDNVNKIFTNTLLYTPVQPGSVTSKVKEVFGMGSIFENFTDNGIGGLIGDLGGNGTINYETGLITINTFNPGLDTIPVEVSYTSLAGFTVLQGSPIVVAQIFHAAAILETDQLDPTHTYYVFGNASDYVTTYNGLTLVSPSVPSNTTFTGVTSFIIGNGTPLVLDYNFLTMDPELKAFSGFWTFKDLVDVTSQVDTSTLEFSNREKFINHDLTLEYDFLKENYSKEASVKSRVIPTISKWVYKGGEDVRDNPYRLNAHPVFGPMNFSPSFVLRTQDPQGFSHEWPYLEQPPHQYPGNLLKDNYYFFYDRIDLSKIKNANPSQRDYFTDYFTFVPADNTPTQERYSFFDFNKDTGLCETFFRGVKLRIKEVIKDTKIEQIKGIKPPFKDKSTKYDGYKFSVLLRPLKEDKTKIQAPVEFNIIENRTTKTIVFLIDLVIDDYRMLNLINPNNLGSEVNSPSVLYPDLLDSHIDYLLLYSMKSKKSEVVINDNVSSFLRGLDANDFGNVKLSIGLNISPSSGLIGNYTVVNVFDNPNYDWDLRDELRNFNKENVIKGSFIYGDTLFPYPLSVNQSQILFGIPGITYSQSINVVTPLGVPYVNFEAPTGSPIFVPYGSQFDWEGYPHTQIHAGNLYLEPIMQRISFGKIAEKINAYSPYIKYTTYYWDSVSSTTKSSTNDFYFDCVEPSKITQVEAVLPQIDEDKPEEFKNESVIGVNHINVAYFDELYRYSGPYEPKFRNVLFFNNQKTDSIVGPNIDLSFKQATFNPNVEGFGYLKNLNIIKVANSDILTLANNVKYKPRYPLLNETPLDTKDYFAFQSNWDPGFWRIYTTKKDYFSQAGTREMLEVKNFFGTKIMKTLSSLRLQDWTIEPQLVSLDLVNVDNYTGEIIYAVAGGKLQALVNVKKRLLRFLMEDGADKEFKKYLMSEFGIGDPDLITDDVVEYLTLNVLPTYEVKNVDLYIRKYKENLNLDIIRGDMTDSVKLQNSYLLDKNFSVQKKSDFVYYFEYKLDDSFKFSLAPSLTIGKI